MKHKNTSTTSDALPKQHTKPLLVTFADANILEQSKQLFSSAYFNGGWQGDFMLLTVDTVPNKDLEWFHKKNILVKKYKTPVLYDKSKKYPFTNYVQYFLFTNEFKKWTNIVYIDTDIIVRASLNKLTKVKGFHAVPELLGFKVLINYDKDRLKSPRNPLSLYTGISDEDYDDYFSQLKKEFNLKKRAFNLGVLAFSTDFIKQDTFDKLIKLFNSYNKINALPVQGEYNLLFGKDWRPLPAAYNTYPNYWMKYYKLPKDKIDGVILHFAGGNKPWQSSNPFYDEWEKNYNKAAFIDLSIRVKPAKTWEEKDIKKYERFISRVHRRWQFKKFINYLLSRMHHILGIVGRKLKRYTPKIYKVLKKILSS